VSDHRNTHDIEHGSRENVSHGNGSAQKETTPRIHRVCVTCNNMFETDPAHFDAKYCPTCRRA